MSIINKKQVKNENGTAFYHAGSGKLLSRLDATLSPYDWEQLQVLFTLVYNKGREVGSEERAAEIRQAIEKRVKL